MRRRSVVFRPQARADLFAIYDWIAERAGRATALKFTGAIEEHGMGLGLASERGRRRDDIRLGLRVTGFMRKVEIAFLVDDDRVTILRLFYGGVNWEGRLSGSPDALYQVRETV